MKNQEGFSAIMLAIIVLAMIMAFMGSAGVYYQNLYGQIQRQKRETTALLVSESIGSMLSRAHNNYDAATGTCFQGTPEATPNLNQLCWASGNAQCVSYSVPGDTGTAHRLCLAGAGDASASSMEVVFVPRDEPLRGWDSVRERYVAWKEGFFGVVRGLSFDVQNAAFAQSASEAAHLPSVSGAPGAHFSSPLNCNITSGEDAYCKRCPGVTGSNMDGCVRVRFCLRPGGCTADEHWVNRVFGFIKR